jgi:magnesium-protoporphyrin O-methyltransferase
MRQYGGVDCCNRPSGYETFFSEKQARRDARAYRKKGLGAPARWIVDAVRRRGVERSTVLEPGGGIGSIQLELLKAGAAHSTVVELSPAYEAVAAELAREVGFEDRIERRVADFAQNGVGDADIVVLHRVVCCYPDYERLLGAAAAKARRTLVFTYPPRHLASRAVIALLNLWPRIRGDDFRAFVHPPEAMAAVVCHHGLELFDKRSRGLWRGMAFSRGE